MEEYIIEELEDSRYAIKRWNIEDYNYNVIVNVRDFETALENKKHLQTLNWND